jgi:hypothetical protein
MSLLENPEMLRMFLSKERDKFLERVGVLAKHGAPYPKP